MPLVDGSSGVRMGMGSRPMTSSRHKLHVLCSGRDVTSVQETSLNERAALFVRDSRGLLPIHVACANHNEEGPDIVSTLLTIEPLCARHTDNLMQLPLHIACRNSGPNNFTWDDRVERPNVVRLLETLLSVYREGVTEEDCDGMLPLQWALHNRNSEGALEAANMLLSVYPDCAIPQPFSLGGHGVDALWSHLVQANQQPDRLMKRITTVAAAVLPMTRIWPDGHHRQEPYHGRLKTADIRDSDPTLQVKRIFFDALRNRLDAIYSNRQKRSKMRKNLREFTTTYSNQVLSQFSEMPPISTATPDPDRTESTAVAENAVNYSAQRCREWLRFGAQYPHILALVPELPQVHTPSLVNVMMKRMEDWQQSMCTLMPKDIVSVLEHLPAHIAAAQPIASASEVLKTLLLVDPRCIEARDVQGRSPLHIACANQSRQAEALVAVILESNPETACAQDHSGMMPLHHACLNNGPAAGSIAARLIAVFSPAAQVADDFGRLPLDCTLYCTSVSLMELIKAVGRAFPPATRILDGDGNTLMHRACFEIERNPQCPPMLEALIELNIRPNPCAIFNFHQQLPMHIAASSGIHRASVCLSHLVDAYIPGAWAKDAHGDSALHHAIRARNLESVKILTSKSRDKAKHIQNNHGHFPLNLATTRQLREAICARGDPTDVSEAHKFEQYSQLCLGLLWFVSSCFIWVEFLPLKDNFWFLVQSVLLVLWALVTMLHAPSVLAMLDNAGWVGEKLAALVIVVKANEPQLLVFPLAVLQSLLTGWIDAEISYAKEVTAACAMLLVSQVAVREDGSRFHALELNLALLYLEMFVIFLYRVAEFVARVAALTLAFLDANHCDCFSNLMCDQCEVKQPTMGVLIAEAVLLLLFFRVGSSDSQKKKKVKLQIDEHIRTWWAGYFNMLGVFFCPPNGTMLTYLGIKQSQTAFLGEVRVFDAAALIVLRTFSNVIFLILVTEVPPVYPNLWTMTVTEYFLLSAVVAIPMQVILAYARFLIWRNIESKETSYFNLMSKREKILSERSHDATNDQIKELNECLSHFAQEKRELELSKKHAHQHRHHRHHHRHAADLDSHIAHHHHSHHHHHHSHHHHAQVHHTANHRRDNHRTPLHFRALAPPDLHPSSSPIRIRPPVHGERMVLPVRRTKTPFSKQLAPPPPQSSITQHSPLAQARSQDSPFAVSAHRDVDSLGVARPTSPGDSGIHHPQVVRPANVMTVMNRETHKKGLHGHGVISTEEEEDDLDFEADPGELAPTTGKRQFFYVDELLTDTSILDQPDCFLLFDTKVFMPESSARRLRRPWSSDMINVKIIFSAAGLSMSHNMWKVQTQLQQSMRASHQASAKSVSSLHAPVVFNRARLRVSIAEVLQIVPEQIIVDEASAAADSEAEMLLLPTKSMSDERSPAQLFVALETLLMDPAQAGYLPAPLGLAVSCKARTMPYSPFLQERDGEDPHTCLPWRNEGGGVLRGEYEDAMRRFELRQFEDEVGESYEGSEEGDEETDSDSADTLSGSESSQSLESASAPGVGSASNKGIWGQMVYHVDSTVNNPMRMEALKKDLQIGRDIIDEAQQKKPWTVSHSLNLPPQARADHQQAEASEQRLMQQKLRNRASFNRHQQKQAAREVKRAISAASSSKDVTRSPAVRVVGAQAQLPSAALPDSRGHGHHEQRVRRFTERTAPHKHLPAHTPSQPPAQPEPAAEAEALEPAGAGSPGLALGATRSTSATLHLRRRASADSSASDPADAIQPPGRGADGIEKGRRASSSAVELHVDGLQRVPAALQTVLHIRQPARRRPRISGELSGGGQAEGLAGVGLGGGKTGRERARGRAEWRQAREWAGSRSLEAPRSQAAPLVITRSSAHTTTAKSIAPQPPPPEQHPGGAGGGAGLPRELKAMIRKDVGRRLASQDSALHLKRARRHQPPDASAAAPSKAAASEGGGGGDGLLSGLLSGSGFMGLNSQLVFWAEANGKAEVLPELSPRTDGPRRRGEPVHGQGSAPGKGSDASGVRGAGGGSSGGWGAKQSLASTVTGASYHRSLESESLTDFRVRP